MSEAHLELTNKGIVRMLELSLQELIASVPRILRRDLKTRVEFREEISVLISRVRRAIHTDDQDRQDELDLKTVLREAKQLLEKITASIEALREKHAAEKKNN